MRRAVFIDTTNVIPIPNFQFYLRSTIWHFRLVAVTVLNLFFFDSVYGFCAFRLSQKSINIDSYTFVGIHIIIVLRISRMHTPHNDSRSLSVGVFDHRVLPSQCLLKINENTDVPFGSPYAHNLMLN